MNAQFTGKRIDNGKEISGYYTYNPNTMKTYIFQSVGKMFLSIEVDPTSVRCVQVDFITNQWTDRIRNIDRYFKNALAPHALAIISGEIEKCITELREVFGK